MAIFVTPLPVDFFSGPVTLAATKTAYGLSPSLISPALSQSTFVEAAQPLHKRKDSAYSIDKQQDRLEPFPDYNEAAIDLFEYPDFLNTGEAGSKISSYQYDDVAPFDIDVSEDDTHEDEPNRVSHPIQELVADSNPDIDELLTSLASAHGGIFASPPIYTASPAQKYTTLMS